MKTYWGKLMGIGAGLFIAFTGGAQPVITQQPTNQTLAVGDTLTMSVTVSGTTPVYQWFKDSRFLLGETNDTLSIANAGMTNSGTYYVVVTNGGGMVISQPALVMVGNPSLLGWGFSGDGQLGIGKTIVFTNRPITVASNVVAGAAGARDSLFITTNGTLWAIGNNQYGQLGNGTTNDVFMPISVASNVVAVAGSQHSLFVQTNGTLWAMGNNQYGQLGNGTTGFGFPIPPPSPTPSNVANNVVLVAAGSYHSLFVKTDGTLWAMGYNSYGQLGNGTRTDTNRPISVASNVVAIAAGVGHSLFVKTDRTLWAMGWNFYGQLGNGTYNNTNLLTCVASNVIAVAAGGAHSLFVKIDGTLWAMGFNGYGQLGNGVYNRTNLPVCVASNVVVVAAGSQHSLFVKTDGTLWAMGDNEYGQLCNGTTNNATLPTNVFYMKFVANIFPANVVNHLLVMGVMQSPALECFTVSCTNVQKLTLQLSGTPYYPYILQSATNLTPPIDWQPVLTNPADVNGNWSITVSNLTGTNRFYRAASQ